MTTRSSSRRERRVDRHAATTPRTSARRSASSARLAWLIALGAAALIGIAGLAIVTTSGSNDIQGGAAGPTSASSATLGNAPALPAFQATADDPAVGRAMPEVRGTSFDGSSVAIANDGRAKVLLFVAHWCPHCQREVPVVQAWLDGRGLEIRPSTSSPWRRRSTPPGRTTRRTRG